VCHMAYAPKYLSSLHQPRCYNSYFRIPLSRSMKNREHLGIRWCVCQVCEVCEVCDVCEVCEFGTLGPIHTLQSLGVALLRWVAPSMPRCHLTLEPTEGSEECPNQGEDR
jgi:hypothetical protein